jgi:hypothetical protein
LLVPNLPRDPELIGLEAQIRACIRDAVNRPSRKPFSWGGLAGYLQLEAISQALQALPLSETGLEYLQRLSIQVERTLEHNRWLAQDLADAQDWLKRIARVLRYPFPDNSHSDLQTAIGRSDLLGLTSAQVHREMTELLQKFQPNLRRQPAQAALYRQWHRLWKTDAASWLHCYDIPGLPPDNLQLEAVFGNLRRRTRRISGRKSSLELRDFGQYQVLFAAESQQELLEQMQQVSITDYQTHRHRLAAAEAPHRLLRQLHRDPLKTMNHLVRQHAQRRATLAVNTLSTAHQKQVPLNRTSASASRKTQQLQALHPLLAS